MTFVGSDPDAAPTAELEQRSYSNYLSGGPAEWRANVPHYSRVRYPGIYPGIDAIFYGSTGKFEYDLVVSPGTSPGVIQLSFTGEEKLEVDEDGDLVVTGSLGTMRQAKPVAYQMFDGRRKVVSADYVIAGLQTVALRVGAYDRSRELIIDPVLSFSSYFGGSGEDGITDIASDAAGNTFIVGWTYSRDLPLRGAFQGANPSTNSYYPLTSYLAKFNPDGALAFSTYLGGSLTGVGDGARQVAVDSEGNILVAGIASSTDFPHVPGPLGNPSAYDGFVVKFNPSGSQILQNAFISGTTVNAYRATSPAANPSQLSVFFTKIDRTGSHVLYSSYFAVASSSLADVAVDAYGDLFLTGTTETDDLPLVNPMDSMRGFIEPFVTKFDSSGSRLVYSTFLGGSRSDYAVAIALDGNGDAHLGGNTNSPDFPTVNPFQNASRDGQTINDAFVAKITDSAGDTLVACGVPPQPAPSGDPGTFTRVEDRYQNNSVIYTGDWHTNISTGQTGVVHSGGSASLAVDPGARATLYFTGTAIKWIGYRDSYSGIAHVFVDGLMRERIDTYSATVQHQSTIFSIQNLPPGPHVITIEVRGEKNPSSGGAWVWLDAFDFAQSASGGSRANSCRVQ